MWRKWGERERDPEEWHGKEKKRVQHHISHESCESIYSGALCCLCNLVHMGERSFKVWYI